MQVISPSYLIMSVCPLNNHKDAALLCDMDNDKGLSINPPNMALTRQKDRP